MASTGVVWTTPPGFAATARPDPLGTLPATRRQREEAQRRVAQAYDTAPPPDFGQSFSPRGLLGRAHPSVATSEDPPARAADDEVVEARQVLVLATAADLRTLHRAIMKASAEPPAAVVRALSLVA